jgi:biotin carboxyl carrier protein
MSVPVESQPSQIPALPGATVFFIEIEGQPHRLELLLGANSSYQAIIDGQPVGLDAKLLQPGVLSLIIEGRAHRCVLHRSPTETAIQIEDKRLTFIIEDRRSLRASRGKRGAASGSQVIKAPMPGRIVRLLVAPGDQVAAHQGVIVIEAMKMQNELKTPRAGRVARVEVAAGATVSANDTLVVIE